MRYYGDVAATNWLYRPVAHLPKRAILDANVLLDLSLMVDSISVQVVRGLKANGYLLYSSTVAIEEAKEMLRQKVPHKDIACVIDMMCDAVAIQKAEGRSAVDKIKSHDQHVASAVADLDGFLITEDIPLIGQMNEAQLHARTLREIALHLIGEQPPRQDLMVFGSGLGADGYLFCKGIADLGLTAGGNRKFYLFDTEGLGTLAYDNGKRAFEFTSEVDGKVVLLNFALMPGRQFALLLEYNVGKRDTAIWLRARHYNRDDEVMVERRVAALQRAPAQSMIGMNRRQKDLGWLGTIQNLSFGPHKLASESWKICSSIVGVAPSTLTADLSFLSALLVDVEPEGRGVRRPTLEQVRTFANVSVAFFHSGRRRKERADPYFPHPAVEWLEREFGPGRNAEKRRTLAGLRKAGK